MMEPKIKYRKKYKNNKINLKVVALDFNSAMLKSCKKDRKNYKIGSKVLL